jgi:hypothetical protein
MAGIRALRKIQLGLETTAGTAVAATALWRGVGVLEDRREVTFVNEDIGYISGVDRTYTGKLLAALAMDAVPATFEQLPYLLAAGVKDVVTGAADGLGSDKIYSYPFPTTAKNTIKTYTIEGGDDQEAEEIEYAFVESFKLSGRPGGALEMSAAWLGRQVIVSAFTGAIAVPTVADILFAKGKLYVDAASGAFGTTLQSNTFLGMDLNVITGWVPVFTADGNLYFTFSKITVPEITLDITFEHDAAGVARKVDWRAETARLVQIKFEGANVATAGTVYSKKTLIVNLAAKVEKVTPLGEQDGNDILTATFRARYNATAAKFAEIIVVNELAALP